MHISRLIGFLLECEFNHVKREKCEKIDKKLKTLLVLESFLFALFQRKEKDPRAEAEVCIQMCLQCRIMTGRIMIVESCLKIRVATKSAAIKVAAQ